MAETLVAWKGLMTAGTRAVKMVRERVDKKAATKEVLTAVQ
jgi:hypothetical protein